jgi:nitroreductase
MTNTSLSAAVDRVMLDRHSIRAFLPTPVARGEIEDILRIASNAPSGNNIQPWRVHVLTGTTLHTLIKRVGFAFDAADGSHTPEYHYYPTEFFEPYLARRRKCGGDLYGVLGISRGEKARMRAQMRKNFEFFAAPVGLMFTIDRRLAQGSWLDYGMFLQNVMLAATARGLATCAQAAWIDYHRIIADVLALPENEQVVAGIALGHADPAAPENALLTGRVAVAEFVNFHP